MGSGHVISGNQGGPRMIDPLMRDFVPMRLQVSLVVHFAYIPLNYPWGAIKFDLDNIQ